MNKYLIILLSTVIVFISSCGHTHSNNEHEHDSDHQEHTGDPDNYIHMDKHQIQEAGIRISMAKLGIFSGVIKVGGQIQSPSGHEQTIVATAAGIVSYTNRDLTDGSPIVAGQSIVSISAKKLQDGDPSQKLRAEYETATKEYERDKQLVGERIISQKEFEQTRLRYETARVAWQAQAGNITSAGVSVSSPIGGFVKNRIAQQGDYVAVGDPILTVTQTRRMQLRADIAESDFAQLKNIRTANFRTSYYNNKVYSLQELDGRLLSYGKTTQQGSAYLPVTFEFNNIGDFVAGSYAEVWLLTRQRNNVISIPISALIEEQGVYYVYLQSSHEPEAFVKREVKIGDNDGRSVEITSGIKVGDKVVVEGAYQVKLAAASASTIPHGHQH